MRRPEYSPRAGIMLAQAGGSGGERPSVDALKQLLDPFSITKSPHPWPGAVGLSFADWGADKNLGSGVV